MIHSSPLPQSQSDCPDATHTNSSSIVILCRLRIKPDMLVLVLLYFSGLSQACCAR